jgi:predicted 3-demethylubiquinone-9 3-methyltransferase (glyoxalase superfamily)
MPSITPFLWYSDKAEEAARFYASVVPDSRVDQVSGLAAESLSGPPGSVKVVQFTLAGRPFMTMSAGPLDPFNHAVSFMIECDGQEEIDRLWNALLDGGQPDECGWPQDRSGLCWQIVPRQLQAWMCDPDPAAAKRTAEAMLTMRKFDLAALERAHAGG